MLGRNGGAEEPSPGTQIFFGLRRLNRVPIYVSLGGDFSSAHVFADHRYAPQNSPCIICVEPLDSTLPTLPCAFSSSITPYPPTPIFKCLEAKISMAFAAATAERIGGPP